MSHHRYRNGKSSIGRARKVYGRRLYDLGYLQVFAKLPVQARGAVLVPDVLVVRDTCEEMVAACRNVRAVGPFLPLQGHVTLFLFLLQDRKSTRLNSSHVSISYAVFCLKKKNI